MFHLPDIPDVGFSTQREREQTDAIMLTIRGLERDRLQLLTIVCEGREKWRRVAKAAFGLKVETDALDAIYDYLTLLACKPAMQVRLLAASRNPEVWRMLVAEAMPDIEQQREAVRLLQKWGM